MTVLMNHDESDTISVADSVAKVFHNVTANDISCIADETARRRARGFYLRVLENPMGAFAEASARYVLAAIRNDKTDAKQDLRRNATRQR